MWPLTEREQHGAVRVVRTFAPNISKGRGLLRYLDSIVSFGLAGYAALRERAEVIIAETDPPILGSLGAILRFVWRRPFVYYCQDVYPEVGVATGALRNRAMLALLYCSNWIAFRCADAVITLASDMAGLLRLKGVPAGKIAVVPNWIDCSLVKPQAPRADLKARYSTSFVVMYAGNFGWTQNLESVLEAARLLRYEPGVKFVLVGDGARKGPLEAEARRKGLSNLDFIDRVDPSKMSDVLAAADLHLIPLGSGVAGSMVPSKVYGILAAGKPFVAMMEKHAEVARIASEAEVGFVVPPGDAAALARTITNAMDNRQLLKEMGLRARALAEHTYDRSIVTRRFATFLEAVLSGEPASAIGDESEVGAALEIEKAVTMPVK